MDDMSDAIDDRSKEGLEDAKTKVSLVNDPTNIGWDDTEKTAIIYLQNSGETFLDLMK